MLFRSASNKGFNQAMGSASYAQVVPVAPMGPFHNAGSLLTANYNQFGTTQQPQMGQVLNASSLLIGNGGTAQRPQMGRNHIAGSTLMANSDQVRMAQRPQMRQNQSDGRRRMTSVGHVGMSQRPSIGSNNNGSGQTIGKVGTSPVGSRPAMAQKYGQPHNIPHGGSNTGFQAGPQNAANANNRNQGEANHQDEVARSNSSSNPSL